MKKLVLKANTAILEDLTTPNLVAITHSRLKEVWVMVQNGEGRCQEIEFTPKGLRILEVNDWRTELRGRIQLRDYQVFVFQNMGELANWLANELNRSL